MRSKEVQWISLKIYTCVRMLKSVLDNSGSRQGRETANPTCHEAMRVQKNEQVFKNIMTKKTTMAIVSSLVGAISSRFPHSFSFLPSFAYLLSPPPPPPFPLLSSPTFPPYLSLLLTPLPFSSLSSLFFRLSYTGSTIKCDRLWEKGHIRAYFQNRVIGTAG